MTEPRAPDDGRKKKPQPRPRDDFFDGRRCPGFPDREQPPAEKRDPF